MRILSLKCTNYRTLQDLTLDFTGFYTAICGKNDSGKTNVVNAVKYILRENLQMRFSMFDEEHLNNSVTHWVAKVNPQAEVSLQLTLLLNSEFDATLRSFIIEYLQLHDKYKGEDVELSIRVTQTASQLEQVTVQILGETYDGQKAQEVLKRIHYSPICFFHSSPSYENALLRFMHRPLISLKSELSAEQYEKVEVVRKNLNKILKSTVSQRQKGLSSILARLNDRYQIELSAPSAELSLTPYNILLGDSKALIELSAWGSGTQNRVTILQSIIEAAQSKDIGSRTSQDRPVIIIEEPESFLHPSAQSDFARLLQELATEYKVQVIVTTHSPYMLSQTNPSDNILLSRNEKRKALRDTIQIDTKGDSWMEPFALSLGLNTECFKPWVTLFTTTSTYVIMVEGDIDVEYFSLLKDAGHGGKGLGTDVDIVPYGGKDALKNQAILRFIRSKYPKLFVTVDLDGLDDVSKSLESVGFEKGKTYVGIGRDKSGMKNIEGLLPDSVKSKVYAKNPDLVGIVANGNAAERKSAKNNIKRLLLDEFRKSTIPGAEGYKAFYDMVAPIKKALGA